MNKGGRCDEQSNSKAKKENTMEEGDTGISYAAAGNDLFLN
mgnify:CR=1 FL=1